MWFYLALSSAVIGAISVIINKALLKRISTSVTTWSLFVFPLPFIIALAIKEGIPEISLYFYIGSIGSALSFVVAKMLALKSTKERDLSKIAPLVIFTTVFHYILGIIFLHEKISMLASLGVGLILIGAYLLYVSKENENWLAPFKMMFRDKYTVYYLIGTFLVGISGILDKLAIINTTPRSPILTILVENTIMATLLTVYLLKKQPTWKIQVKSNFFPLLFSGLVYGLLAIVVMSAFANAPVAIVTGIKKLQILFILLFSWIIWKDKPSRNTIWGTLVMLIGVVLIKI